MGNISACRDDAQKGEFSSREQIQSTDTQVGTQVCWSPASTLDWEVE